jgi:hypothetical protein
MSIKMDDFTGDGSRQIKVHELLLLLRLTGTVTTARVELQSGAQPLASQSESF